jgi:hypothetical protein
VTKRGFLQKEIREILDVADTLPAGFVFLIPVILEQCPIPSRLSQWQWVTYENEELGAEFLSHAFQKAHAAIPDSETEEASPGYETMLGPDSLVLFLLHGRAKDGRKIFSYLKLTLRSANLLKDRIIRGDPFDPRWFGEVVASGEGEPSADLRKQMEDKFRPPKHVKKNETFTTDRVFHVSGSEIT